jgi:hypothetical protein
VIAREAPYLETFFLSHNRMIAGEAPHLETFFLSHKYGRPKDVDQVHDKPPRTPSEMRSRGIAKPRGRLQGDPDPRDAREWVDTAAARWFSGSDGR